MCDTTFTFGQSGSHFFQCPTRRDYDRLPRKLQKLLTSNQIWHIHHVTLGFEDSFLITWRDKIGGDHIESRGLPQELNDFLFASNSQKAPIRNIPALRLTLGPYNTSFFVHDNSAYLWMDLPPLLLTALQSRIKDGAWADKPRIVALGADQDFLLITEKNAAVWELSHYRTLSSMLEFSRTQERGIQEIKHVVLHAYRYQCFIAQSRNGTLLYENMPPHEEPGVESMKDPVMRDTKEEERKRNRRLELQAQVQRRPSVQRQVTTVGDRAERRQEFRVEGRGVRLSLKLGFSVGNIARMLGS